MIKKNILISIFFMTCCFFIVLFISYIGGANLFERNPNTALIWGLSIFSSILTFLIVFICPFLEEKETNNKINNKINLEPIIEDMYQRMTNILKTVGWERKDLGYFEYNLNSKKNNNGIFNLPESSIVLFPVLLEYSKENKQIIEIWFKSENSCVITEKAKQEIFKVLKPFKDEDYIGDNFWINPDYPDGYWQNHVLD